MKKVDKEFVSKLKDGIEFEVYNPMTKQHHKWTTSKRDISKSKWAYSELEYYVSDEIVINEIEEVEK